MYYTLTLSTAQYNEFKEQLCAAHRTIEFARFSGNFIMRDNNVPVTLAITSELYTVLHEVIGVLRECDGRIVPRPTSIEHGNWMFMEGDRDAFDAKMLNEDAVPALKK